MPGRWDCGRYLFCTDWTGQGFTAQTGSFFFQAEDCIRYYKVTGVQTCALPIYPFLRPGYNRTMATPVICRTISECIALFPEDSTAVMDADFATDVEAAIESHRESLEPPAW